MSGLYQNGKAVSQRHWLGISRQKLSKIGKKSCHSERCPLLSVSCLFDSSPVYAVPYTWAWLPSLQGLTCLCYTRRINGVFVFAQDGRCNHPSPRRWRRALGAATYNSRSDDAALIRGPGTSPCRQPGCCRSPGLHIWIMDVRTRPLRSSELLEYQTAWLCGKRVVVQFAASQDHDVSQNLAR